MIIPPDSIADILVISMGGIGNMVLLTPALSALHEHFPAARIHFLLSKNGAVEIIRHFPAAGSLFEVRSQKTDLFRYTKKLRRIRPDIVVTATGTNPLKSGSIGLVVGARFRAGEAQGWGRLLYNVTVTPPDARHEVQSNLRIVQKLGCRVNDHTITVWTTDDDRQHAAAILSEINHSPSRPLVGIHTGSGPAMRYKRWPEERFLGVCKTISSRHHVTFLLVGGPEEHDVGERFVRELRPQVVNLIGRVTIRQSFELLRHCAVFISNDTGPMHLAAAAGVPVVAMFGPTLDRITSPWGAHHKILTADIPCRPCYRYRPVSCDHRECLHRITVEQVVEAVEGVLVSNSTS